MADVSSAIAAAVALAMGGDRGLLGSSNPTRKTSSSTSAAQPCSLPPETTLQAATAAAASKLTQGQDNSGLGRFYVIRATEDQPAPAAGHFVKVVSGPHNGYDAAVASVKDPRTHEGNGNNLGGNGSSGRSGRGLPTVETSVKEQLSRLLQQPPGGGALSGLPVQLEEGVRNNRMDPAALQRLLNPSQEQKSASPKDEEQIFLPLDTPVWHLPSGAGDGSLMVTRAENVEWMRMIWGKMDDPSAIVEMLAKQQKEKEEEEKSEADRARRQQEEQEHQKSDQQRLLTQVMSSLGSSAGAAHQQQRNHQPAANPSTQDLLAQLLGGQDYSAVPKETEFAPPGPRHARKTSLESMSMFESMGSLMSPQHTSMSGGAAPSLLNLFDQPPPAAVAMSPVRAALTPGTLAPGTGPFYVVMADSRIQLTANGFNLSVASGPHGVFEEALASMAAVSHRRSMPRKDAQMVHVTSETPIWHSLDLAHSTQPTMIVKACSLQGAPFKLDDDASAMPPPPSPGMGSLQQHLSFLGALTQSPRQSPVTLAPLPASSAGPPPFSITSQPYQPTSKQMPPPPAHILEMTTSYHQNPEPVVHRAQEQQQGQAGHGDSGSALPRDSTYGEPSEGSLKRPLGTSNTVPNKKAHILGRQGSASPPPECPEEAEEQPEALHGDEGNQEAQPDEAEAHRAAPDVLDDGVEENNGDEGEGNEDGEAKEEAHGDDAVAEEGSDGA